MQNHTYIKAEKFILSREFFGMKLGLENITEFLNSIGSPQKKYYTIHLAGTNGKGSTSAMLASILQAAGYKTGLFTSPHLVEFRERVKVNGQMIPKRAVAGFINRNRPVLVKKKLSFFELVTALAFDFFSRQSVDIAVIETGLGGRLDATNVLKPLVTVITDISHDHSEILGNSLKQIAYEKAGIIKRGVPTITGRLSTEAMTVIKMRCKELVSPHIPLRSKDYSIDKRQLSLKFNSLGFNFNKLTPALNGIHQLQNSALALKTITTLRKKKLTIPKKAVISGLYKVEWQGRFQIIEGENDKPLVLLDVCHNEAGAKSFTDTFKRLYPGKKAQVVVGFVKHKDHQALVNNLIPITERFWLVSMPTKRSIIPAELAKNIDWNNVPIKIASKLGIVWKRLLKDSPQGSILAVVGSHYLVGQFLKDYGR